MSASQPTSPAEPATVARRGTGRLLRSQAGLIVLAAYHLALALFMAIAPHAFYTAIGPFGELNAHYIRDVATFSAALGVGFARRGPPALLARAGARDHDRPVRACTPSTTSLDIEHAPTRSGPGYFDFVSLLASTVLLAWLWRAAARRTRSRAGPTTRPAGPEAHASFPPPPPKPKGARHEPSRGRPRPRAARWSA